MLHGTWQSKLMGMYVEMAVIIGLPRVALLQ
jgi:hypothetical protein